MGFTQKIYNEMVSAGEVDICPHFCSCKMCTKLFSNNLGHNDKEWGFDFE